jgi:hypothetical protein
MTDGSTAPVWDARGASKDWFVGKAGRLSIHLICTPDQASCEATKPHQVSRSGDGQ